MAQGKMNITLIKYLIIILLASFLFACAAEAEPRGSHQLYSSATQHSTFTGQAKP
ncbi:hypothetical protein [Mucilaginibacter oryzae]|uniref:hypothetical protein n=1 Tax=Mucilaginibacter oryzae TaxID=468058 RepID=UPI001473D9CE|nr:hypothetical protein [Mucilaginibacter oryzae]